MMKKLMTIACAAALGLGLTACGGGSGPEDAVKEFADAAGDKDFKKVCSLLDPEFVKTAEEAAGDTCENSMKKAAEDGEGGELMNDPGKLEVGDATVSDDGKTATVPTTYDGEKSDVKLVKVDDAWKITFGL